MDTTLSRLIFPSCQEEREISLYYHTDGPVHGTEAGLHILNGSTLTLDTYFNGFFYTKYVTYTHVTEIICRLDLNGSAWVRLLCLSPSGELQELYSIQTEAGSSSVILPPVSLASLPKEGMVYVEIRALSEDVFLSGGGYFSTESPENKVKLAAVICTYHREAYVKRNLFAIEKTIWRAVDCPCQTLLDVFLVDNGGTLSPEKHPHLHIFTNKNYGGSGGFTRGILEAYRRKEEYTHVLLMDDDISFETETLVRTVQFLRYAKELDRPLCIGGQMLIEDRPTIQFEAGAFYLDGRLSAVNRDLDLSSPSALLKNDQEHDVQYNAWWYCCFPVSVVDTLGLPLPFFIKTDDVEYGLRMNPHVVLLNGIGVWHQAFDEKYSPHLEYYIKRNELIVSSIHHSGDGVFKSIWKLFRAAGKAILIGDPRVVDYILWASDDFLKGPEFFLQVEDDVLNTKLIQHRSKKAKNRIHSILTDPIRLLPVFLKILIGYSSAQRAYCTHIQELTSLSFWRTRLGINTTREGEIL